MLHKNLRSVLFYVVGVSFVCLMIEIRKRSEADFYSLDPSLYAVQTASQDQLRADPVEDLSEDDADIVPLRNRGRPNPDEELIKQKEDKKVAVSEAELKSKYREWKKEQGIVGRKEKGMFKKWKVDQGYAGQENQTAATGGEVEEESFKAWKAKNTIAGSVPEKGLFKKWKIEKGTNKKALAVDQFYTDTEDDAENEKETGEDQEKEQEQEQAKEEDKEEDLKNEPVAPITEYVEAAEHSCKDFEFTEELVSRTKSVQENCQRLGEEVAGQTRMLSRLRWAIKERLLYCPVFKAASTTWLINYLKLSNSTIDPKVGNLHTRITNIFPAPTGYKLRKKIFEESLKFLIVRHPFERLVSAYRDKLAGFTRHPGYLRMRKLIIQHYRKKPSRDNSTIPTFREAVDFVLYELEKMERGSSNINIDGHFMPYSRRCMPCGMDYDVIIKFETLEEDSDYIINQCGLQDRISLTHENRAPTGTKTEQGFKEKGKKKAKKSKSLPAPPQSSSLVALDYFKDISEHKIKQLYKHYRLDFLIFGYSADDYLPAEEENKKGQSFNQKIRPGPTNDDVEEIDDEE